MDVDTDGETAQPRTPGMVMPDPAVAGTPVPHAQPAGHSKQLAHHLTPSPSGDLAGPDPKRRETKGTRAMMAAREAAQKQAAKAAAAAAQRKASRSASRASKQ